MTNIAVEELIGKTIVKIEGEESSTELLFTFSDGERVKMYHEQDCCESVSIEDIVGNMEDLLNTPLLVAEERTSINDSGSWSFYEFATIRGSVTIRWYGESNGHYSERVDLVRLNKNEA